MADDVAAAAELAQITSIASTEQFVLMMARSNVLADLSQRSTLFFTSVSSTLIALALVAQATRFGVAFVMLTCVMFVTLYILGFLTYVRAIQQSIEDNRLIYGLARIRHFYTEVAPGLAPYLVSSVHDDHRGILADMGLPVNRYQSWLTTASAVALVNSVLGSAVVSVVAAETLGVTLLASVAVALVTFVVSLILHRRAEAAIRAHSMPHEPMFPFD